MTLPQSLSDHLAGNVTTVCFAWIVTRRDGVQLGFTDHDRALTVGGVSCEPATGFTPGAVETGLGFAGDTSEVAGALSSEAISEDDIALGRYDGARVEQYLVNWAAPEDHALVKRHVVGEIRQADGAFRVELRSLSTQFDARRGRHYLRLCDADLGDGRCKFDTGQAGFSTAGAVTAVAPEGALSVSGLDAYPDDWFVQGRLTWTSGMRAGTAATVASVRDGSVTFLEPGIDGVGVGDAFTLAAGCDKRFATCREKFANGINFRGFPHIPGNDAALTYADGEGDFDGGPIVA